MIGANFRTQVHSSAAALADLNAYAETSGITRGSIIPQASFAHRVGRGFVVFGLVDCSITVNELAHNSRSNFRTQPPRASIFHYGHLAVQCSQRFALWQPSDCIK